MLNLLAQVGLGLLPNVIDAVTGKGGGEGEGSGRVVVERGGGLGKRQADELSALLIKIKNGSITASELRRYEQLAPQAGHDTSWITPKHRQRAQIREDEYSALQARIRAQQTPQERIIAEGQGRGSGYGEGTAQPGQPSPGVPSPGAPELPEPSGMDNEYPFPNIEYVDREVPGPEKIVEKEVSKKAEPWQLKPPTPTSKWSPMDMPGVGWIPAAVGGLTGLLSALGKTPEFNRHETSQFWRNDFKKEFRDISEQARQDPYTGDFFRNANRAAQTAMNTTLAESANTRARQAAAGGTLYGGGASRDLASVAPGFYANQGNLLSRAYDVQHQAAAQENQYTLHNTDEQQQHYQWEVQNGFHPMQNRGMNLVSKALGSALGGAAAVDNLASKVWERGVMNKILGMKLGKWTDQGNAGTLTQQMQPWAKELSSLGMPGEYGTRTGPLTQDEMSRYGHEYMPWSNRSLSKVNALRTANGLNPINFNPSAGQTPPGSPNGTPSGTPGGTPGLHDITGEQAVNLNMLNDNELFRRGGPSGFAPPMPNWRANANIDRTLPAALHRQKFHFMPGWAR